MPMSSSAIHLAVITYGLKFFALRVSEQKPTPTTTRSHFMAEFASPASALPKGTSGLQVSTIRNIPAVWVFKMPVAALLSGILFYLFCQLPH
jgi:phosphate/sulfate permease